MGRRGNAALPAAGMIGLAAFDRTQRGRTLFARYQMSNGCGDLGERIIF